MVQNPDAPTKSDEIELSPMTLSVRPSVRYPYVYITNKSMYLSHNCTGYCAQCASRYCARLCAIVGAVFRPIRPHKMAGCCWRRRAAGCGSALLCCARLSPYSHLALDGVLYLRAPVLEEGCHHSLCDFRENDRAMLRIAGLTEG